MFRIYADDVCIHDDIASVQESVVISPTVTLADNSAGMLTMTVPYTNVGYSKIRPLDTLISIIKNGVITGFNNGIVTYIGEMLWQGRVIEESKDFYTNRILTCEGSFAFLNDSVQSPQEYNNATIYTFLESLIYKHNQQSSNSHKFTLGTIDGTPDSVPQDTSEADKLKRVIIDVWNGVYGNNTERKTNLSKAGYDYATIQTWVNQSAGYLEYDSSGRIDNVNWTAAGIVFPEDSGYVSYSGITRKTNYETTMDLIRDEILDVYGGHICIRYESGTAGAYIDYLIDYPKTAEQTIYFGENLIDYTDSWSADEYVTQIVPFGAKIDGTDDYLTVKSVNDGSAIVADDDAVEAHGKITRRIQWDGITDANTLLTLAKLYLSETRFEDLVISVDALDLSYLSSDRKPFELLDKVRVVSTPHGLDAIFPITKIVMPLSAPEETRFTIGGTLTSSLSDIVSSGTDSGAMKVIRTRSTSI